VVGGRWVADRGDREGKEASPGACTTWASAGLGVDLGVDLGAEGGWGLWWGLGGVFGGVLGGEGAADKEEREGRCTLTKKIREWIIRPRAHAVCRNFCALLLGDVLRSRTRNTRGIWHLRRKRQGRNLELAGKMPTGMFEYKS
jgi:hypothetical protein